MYSAVKVNGRKLVEAYARAEWNDLCGRVTIIRVPVKSAMGQD